MFSLEVTLDYQDAEAAVVEELAHPAAHTLARTVQRVQRPPGRA